MANKRGKKPSEPVEVPEQEWDPRPYQQNVFDARHGRAVAARGGFNERGNFVGCNGWEHGRGACERFMLIWHRRAGKDRTGLELIREEADKHVGAYWHLYPLQVQAKKAIWNGVDPATETRLLELVFPKAMRVDVDERDLFMRFRNGSTYQLCGSDNYDRLVGSNVRGAVFSEWALCDPRAWPYIMPILVENHGWAAFITTYRGRNHAYQMVQRLARHPGWYVDVQTIEHTIRGNGLPVVSAADVAQERESLIAVHRSPARADALIREEFYCDPMASLPGSVYGKQVAELQAAGRA